MRAVNLLPRETTKRQTRIPATPVLVAVPVTAMVGGLVAAGFLFEKARVSDKQKELEAVQAQLAATPKPVPEDPANAELIKEKNDRITAVAGALSERMAFDRLLRELSRVLPEDVWLTSLGATAPGVDPAAAAAAAPTGSQTGSTTGQPAPAPAAPSATGEGLQLAGYTYSQEGVARLLARLAVVPYVKGVQLRRSTLTEVSKRRIVEFTIVAQLRTQKELG